MENKTLKEICFGEIEIQKIAKILSSSIKNLNEAEFYQKVTSGNYKSLELMERKEKLTEVLESYLPDFPLSKNILVEISRDVRKILGDKEHFQFIFIPYYLEKNAINYIDDVLEILPEITKLFSAEFCIRPFIQQNPTLIYQEVRKYTKHADERVRRLASEGLRPLLPWGKKIPYLTENYHKNIEILELLIEDNSLYVRKSVANHLNDISKLDPELVLNFAKRWKNSSKEINWVLEKGLRTLTANQNQKALSILGIETKFKINKVESLYNNEPITLGEDKQLNFIIHFEEETKSKLDIRLIIYYPRLNKQPLRKVFKVYNKNFNGKILEIKHKLSTKNLSTRKHYSGDYKVEITINGNFYKGLPISVIA